MKKVVLASLLAFAVVVPNIPSAFAQTPVQLGSQPAGQVQMPEAEYSAYSNAMNQSDPRAKASGIEAYLTAYPNSAVKLDVLVTLLATYGTFDTTGVKILDAADRVLQIDPTNLRALTFETYLRKSNADSLTDVAAKQAALDAAAGYAQKGLAAPKPAATADADFKAMQAQAFPIFYSTIGAAALNKKDSATAIDAYKKELANAPIAKTQEPGQLLQDTYYLGVAYQQSTPSDLLNCTFYVTRFVTFAPEPYKTQMSPLAKYCYKKYHGGDDGYDAIVAGATANLNPPAALFASIKAAPTPAEKIHSFISTTPDLATLAIADKEMVFQYGSQEDIAKVWDTIKGKSVQIPDATVIESTPTVLKVAVTDDAKQNKTADFTFNLAPAEVIAEPEASATPAQKAAYKKAVADAAKKADQIAAATSVGKTVTLTGTYDSFVSNPVQIIMKDGDVVLKVAKAPAAAAHHPAAHAGHK
jgi:hypothetical protein